MKLTSIIGFFLILFMLLFTFSLYSRIPPTSGTSDLNQLDANGLYVQKNPLAPQTINGQGLDINNSSAVDSTLDLRNNGGASVPILRTWTGSSLGVYVQDLFGFPGVVCPSGRVICFFGLDTLGAYFALTAPGFGKSAFNSSDGFQFQGGAVEISGGNLHAINSASIVSDNDVNARDLNVSRGSNLQNLRVNNDANFLRNARIKDSLYVDVNIFADTFEKDRLPEWALDLCYVNNGKRDVVVYGSILSNVKKDADLAYVDIYTDTGCTTLVQSIGIQYYSDTLATNTGLSVYDAFSFLVHDGNSFMLTTNITGSSSISLNTIRSYFP